MDFRLTEEQIALKDTLARFIAQDYTFAQRSAFARSADGYSRERWRRYAELGLLALPFPEQYGGLNGTPIDVMVVMEALAPALTLEPYLETAVLCGRLLLDAGSDAQKHALLPAVASGALQLALAHDERGASYDRRRVATSARRVGADWLLNGSKA